MTTVMRVGGASPYDVAIGPGTTSLVPEMVSGATTVAIVVDPTVATHAARIADGLRARDIAVVVLPVPAGEEAKSLTTVAHLWDELGAARLTRNDAIVAVGGGATTDVSGFAAATWLRGIRIVQVPTTLLAMVDAAVGGKTGINTDAGKNLVGSFHPPAGVVVDLDFLATLPKEQWVNGMAEVLKAGFIADPAILELVESDFAGASNPNGPSARELIERAIAMKVDVVSRDLKEAGLREMLNYGHTLGHAIERLEGYRIPHGHAVSIGMVFAAGLGKAAGTIDGETVMRHQVCLAATGLPTTYRPDALPELVELMRIDKKARGDKLRFVVLKGLAAPVMLEDPDPSMLDAAYREVARNRG
ncbi:MAG TPA: 3-dehydroquinate synthase [Mycobacteriales bacterium]|nr:3-dehydroquinate synthase [Mycobacteriales bacterium]